ncbi:MAG: sulfatase-like hydrolase/transferase [Gemmataceae bacterium]
MTRCFVFVLCFAACLWVSVWETHAAERPNIILIMADDMGWGDPGFQGNKIIKTPHLDKMSREGLVFNRFYAAAPVCSPTRGACLTGRHPYRYGIYTANRGHLRRGEITLAEVLKQAGYTTGHFGKWHLGTMTPDYSGKGRGRNPKQNYCTPSMSGFDEWFSTEFAVATWDPYDPANSHIKRGKKGDPRALYWHNGKNVKKPLDGCDSKIIMDQAIPFIEKAAKDKTPFFSVIWFHAPHAPVVGGPRYRAMYPKASENEQHYYATVTALDEQIGRLRAKLRKLGIADDTMIWFCSDNGPEGNPGPRGRFQGTAGILRGRKRSLYEGGIRVPAILVWPSRLKKARRTDVPCVTSDYFPTVLAALGKQIPKGRPFDGINLLPLLDGKMKSRPKPIGFQSGKQAAWNDNRYVLIHNQGKKRNRSDNGKVAVAEFELYDVVNDPGQTKNIADQHPQIVTRMKKSLQEWVTSCRNSDNGKDY